MADPERTGPKQIFLSCDREEAVEAFAVRLKHDLERSGFTVFLDVPRSTGSDRVDAIGEGLHNSTVLVAVITNTYLTSSYCSDELSVASSNRKPIFPVIFEDIDVELLKKSMEVKRVIERLCWSFFRPKVDNYVGSLNWLVHRLTQDVSLALSNKSGQCESSLDMSHLYISSQASLCHPAYRPHPLALPTNYPSPLTTPQMYPSFTTSLGYPPQSAHTDPFHPHRASVPHHPPNHPGFSMQYSLPGDDPSSSYPVQASGNGINPQAQRQVSAVFTGLSSPSTPPSNRLRAGMKLEALDRRFPYYICVATVTDTNDDGQVKVHFDGWGPEYDYWCHSDDIELHPVGWCSKHSYELYTTRGFQWQGWDQYLMDTISEGADSSYFNEVQLAPPGSLLFRPGMRLEAKDPKNPEHIQVATITKIIDEQLLIHFDGWADDYDYWCSPDSPDIHPAMWTGKHRKKLEKPQGYEGDFRWSRYLADPDVNPAPAHCFTKAQLGPPREARGLFEVGMKLEAKDRKNPGLVCVATITEIQGNSLLIHFDGWSKYYDYWCQPDTVDIHPVGWCEEHGHELQKPNGFSGSFSWESYLHQNRANSAPPNAFSQEQRNY